ncbi:MAG TPA: glycosyltransferase family 2 protein, partial [Candidatus Absconditabacterales bacterium]|nr:glycosyltransferase family 2 protein [Candidatus Absconditabacterales bacterium]
MIATKPLLSICIPTYNREKYLKRLIDSIVHQKGFTNEIEIVIDDGPSKDGTERLIKQYQQTYKNIRYFRNTKAVGMTASFLEAISLSNGKYTWLFGSDDFMYKNALEIVIDIIKSKSPTVILPNRLSFSDIEKCKEYKETDIKLLDFQGFSDFGIYLGL